MNNELILVLTFSIPILFVAGYFIWLYKRRRKHAETLKSDWNKFEKAIDRRNISGIIKYGNRLSVERKLDRLSNEQNEGICL